MRRFGAVIAGLLVAVPLAGCTHHPSACQQQVAAGEAKVRTDHVWTAADLPGIGDYPDIHWQTRALGDPCDGRAVGPTDWVNQGVIAMRPEDATKLYESWDWSPGGADVPALLPGLASYLPKSAAWQHSDLYQSSTSGSFDVLFDPARDVLLVTEST